MWVRLDGWGVGRDSHASVVIDGGPGKSGSEGQSEAYRALLDRCKWTLEGPKEGRQSVKESLSRSRMNKNKNGSALLLCSVQ